MTYMFPLESVATLVERIDKPPSGVRVRRWVLRDDNEHLGVLPLDEDPAYAELYWKANPRGHEQLVGTFRLHLAALLAADYVRLDREEMVDGIRLRFHRGARGVIYIQERAGGPTLPIGVVDVTLS